MESEYNYFDFFLTNDGTYFVFAKKYLVKKKSQITYNVVYACQMDTDKQRIYAVTETKKRGIQYMLFFMFGNLVLILFFKLESFFYLGSSSSNSCSSSCRERKIEKVFIFPVLVYLRWE